MSEYTLKTDLRQTHLAPGDVAHRLDVRPETVIRWIVRGVRTRSGRRTYLLGRKVGGRWRIAPNCISRDGGTVPKSPFLPQNPRF